MKHIKWLILLTCFTSCLNLWANEKESIAVAYPDTLICMNGNDSIVSTGFLLPTNNEQLYSICIPDSSNESYIGIQNEMLQEGTTSSSVAYDVKTYTVTVTSNGNNGYVSCSDTQIRNDTKTFTIEEGGNFTITAIPDEGYRVKYIRHQQTGYISYTTDYTDRETTSHPYSLYNIKTDVTFTVEFEKIYEGKTIYTVALNSNTEHGYISYSGDVIRNSTKTYHVEEGTDFSFKAIPNEGYRVKNIIRKMEGTEAETWSYSDNTSTEQYFTSYSISKNQSIEVNFERIPGEIDNNIYLSIIQSDSNGTKLQVEGGEQVRLQIQATGNRRIQSVIYEGEDVTSQIVDGYFTTPPIYQNVVLHIIYEPK